MISVTTLARHLPAVVLAGIICLALTPAAQGQTTVLDEPFDDDSQFSPSAALFSDGSGDFFGIADGDGDGGEDFGGGTAPSVKAYTGLSDNFLTGQDLDGEGASLPITVEWTGLSIGGLSNLEFSGDFAEFFDSPGDIDDADDIIRVEYQIDGGGFQDLLSFQGADFSSSGSFNGLFREDTNFDGTGDGTALGNSAQTFTKSIAGSGSTLDLRLTVSVNSGDEDFAVDNFTVTGTSGGGGTNLAIAPDNADQSEGDSGTTPFTFTVTRSGDTSGTTDVDFAVTGSGTDGADATDFGGTLPSGTVSFAANDASETITVSVTGDATAEPDETFTVTLSNPTGGAPITTATADGTIRTDDIDTSLPFAETFDTGLGTFTTQSVASNEDWSVSGGRAVINGFGANAASDDWLISPGFDLSGTGNEEIAITTSERFEGPDIELFYALDYAGDVETTTWVELVGGGSATPSFPDNSTNSTFSSSETTVVSLPSAAANASSVHFAVQYTTTGTGGGGAESWRVDDFEVRESTTPPVFVSAAVDGTTLTITYDEALDTSSVPDAGDFTVTGGTSGAVGVSTVGISGTDVTLTLASTVQNGEAVTLDYTPGTNPIQDPGGNDATALSGQSVTNNTPAPTPDVVINEILADPDATNGDANGDGTRDGSEDEFVEIVNNDGASVDISGWTINDGFGLRHTFPAGTVLADGEPIVVFGGGTPTGPFGGALVQTATDGQLGLNNGGDTVTLNDGTSDVDSHTYGSEGGNDESITRDPDITGSTFVAHSGATGSGGALFSPGTQIDGSSFSGGAADTTPPAFVSAAVDGTTLTITYDEALDTGSVPDAGDFSVTGGMSGAVGVSTVGVSGTDVTLTLASAVQNGEAVTLDYTPGTNPIQDPGGNDATALSGQSVTNNTPAPTPDVVINEILADPDATNGDANGDGTVSTTDDEFVEIVNNNGANVDISGWTISDGFGVRHTFPSGTVLSDGEALVVFAGGTPSDAFGGAVVQTASTGQTGFNNSGDTVTLNDGTSDVDSHTYGSEGGNNESITRSPDVTGGFVQHTSATGSGGALFSPGTQIDGSPFSGAVGPFAATIVGEDNPPEGNDRGFRMLAFPTAFTASTLEDDLDFSTNTGSILQTFPGGANGDPWTNVTDLSTTIERGQGFILFFFDDNIDPLESDGIQLDVPNSGEDQEASFETPTLPATEEYQVLGNPFDEAFDLSDGLPDLTTTGFGATVAIWDGDLGQYRLITQGDPDDQVPAFNGFVIQRTTVGQGASDETLTFDPAGKTGSTGDLVGTQAALPSAASAVRVVELQVTATDGSTTSRSTARLRLADDATVTSDWDAYDFGALPPPAANDGYALAGFPLLHNGAPALRAVASEPYTPGTTIDLDVPLHVEGVGLSGTATITWPEDLQTSDYVPASWNVGLVDTAPGDGSAVLIHDLRAQGAYTFDLSAGNAARASSDARFRLRLTAGPLPVELTHFEAMQTNDGVRLQWQTSSETNNAGYHVERRTDGTNAWNVVGFVEGSGTTTEAQTYRFRDTDVPFGATDLTYRLRQVDVDGTSSYSDTRTVQAPTPQATTLHAPFPNPATRDVALRYELSEPTDVELYIYDLLGRQALRVAGGQQPAGQHEVRIPIGRLAPGSYFLRMTTGTTVQTQRLTVVR